MERREPRTRGGFLRRPLDTVLAAPSHLAILRALRGLAVGVTGRDVGRMAGLSPKAAHDALARLERAGLVRRLFAGRSHLFRLNRDHYLARNCLLPLLEAERGYRHALVGTLRGTLGRIVLSSVLFGSAARGEDGPESDIDLLVVVADASRKERAAAALSRLSDGVQRSLGLRLSPLVLTKAELLRDYGRDHPLIRNVLAEGAGILGRDLHEILHG